MKSYKHFNDNCPVCFGDGVFDAGDDAQGNSTYIVCPACKANAALADARKVIEPFAIENPIGIPGFWRSDFSAAAEWLAKYKEVVNT